MHLFLKDIGIQHNSFFLVLLDPDLAGVNPRDPSLNRLMKQKILRECITNFWYFIREVVRIPTQGGEVGGGVRYELNRGNLAFHFLHDKALEDVAFLDVVVLHDAHAALVTGGDFLDRVLEALQGSDLALVDDDVVP